MSMLFWGLRCGGICSGGSRMRLAFGGSRHQSKKMALRRTELPRDCISGSRLTKYLDTHTKTGDGRASASPSHLEAAAQQQKYDEVEDDRDENAEDSNLRRTDACNHLGYAPVGSTHGTGETLTHSNLERTRMRHRIHTSGCRRLN
eukprot:2004553-Pleurochrysis_carterae.AAC.3